MIARLVLDAQDIVGESLIWSPKEAALYWVDIVGSRIHRLDPETGAHEKWRTPELPTSISLRNGGGFVVGLRQRVTLWRPGGEFETLAVPEPDASGNRLNEGVVGPDGAFWVGTMQENIGPSGAPKEMTAATGAIYRITADGAVHRLSESSFGIVNTMIWTDDQRFNAHYVYDWDRDAGRIANCRPFGSSIERGLPDGSTRDAGGVIYNARVAGGKAIARISSEGALLEYLELPCASPTSCAFGGPDLGTLYVTSARFGITDADIAAHPQEGGLFALSLGEGGAPAFEFGN
jgi:sugar lactone lactonase YvrE